MKSSGKMNTPSGYAWRQTPSNTRTIVFTRLPFRSIRSSDPCCAIGVAPPVVGRLATSTKPAFNTANPVLKNLAGAFPEKTGTAGRLGRFSRW